MDKKEIKALLDNNLSYEGIGFNGPHIAKMSIEQLTKEVAHHQLTKEQIAEVSSLAKKKYSAV